MERYERNQRRLAENRARAESKGSPREVVVAGRVDLLRPLRSPHVHPLHRSIRQFAAPRLSECSNRKRNGPQCQSLAGKPLDDLVAAQVLTAAPEPASLELSLNAAGELQKNENAWTATGNSVWSSRYDAEGGTATQSRRTRKSTCRPRTGARWKPERLKALQDVENKSMRGIRQTHPPTLSTEERETIRSLSKNLPALWHASTTTSTRSAAHPCVCCSNEPSSTCARHPRASMLRCSGPAVSPHSTNSSDLFFVTIKSRTMPGWLIAFRNCAIKDGRSSKSPSRLNQEGFRPAKRAEFHNEMLSQLVRKLEQQRPGERVTAPRKSLKPERVAGH